MGIPVAAFPLPYGAVATGYPEIHLMGNLASGLLCCLGALGGLSAQPTVRLRNALGIIGVTAGIASTVGQGLMQPSPELLAQMAATCGIGGIIGTTVAMKIENTDLSQLVAAFHSLVGMTVCLTYFATYFDHYPGFVTDPVATMLELWSISWWIPASMLVLQFLEQQVP